MKGLYIVVEGGDGTGKGTLISGLAERIRSTPLFRKLVLISEPGSGSIGPEIKRILDTKKVAPLTQLFLFLAARAQIVREIILPAINSGKVVLSDRSFLSSIAYQVFGGGMSKSLVKSLSFIALGDVRPDLAIILDIDPEIGLARVRARGEGITPFEQEKLDYHRRVREGYLALAKDNPEKTLVIDATLPAEEVLNTAFDKIHGRLISHKTKKEEGEK